MFTKTPYFIVLNNNYRVFLLVIKIMDSCVKRFDILGLYNIYSLSFYKPLKIKMYCLLLLLFLIKA